LHKPVVVNARVQSKDDIVGQDALQGGNHVFGTDRCRDRIEVWLYKRSPFRDPLRDFRSPRLESFTVDIAPSIEAAQYLATERFCVGDQAQVRLVVSSKLCRVQIDVQKLGTRKIP